MLRSRTASGPARVRRSLSELIDLIADRTIDPGKVFIKKFVFPSGYLPSVAGRSPSRSCAPH